AELGFLAGVGSMKVLLARGVTYERDPRFLEGGLFEMGAKGSSFPSGHAAEAVLIYGAAVYLIAHYTGASARLVRNLRRGDVATAVYWLMVSFLIRWHWVSALVGGLVAGAVFLRPIVDGAIRSRRRAAEAGEEPLPVRS